MRAAKARQLMASGVTIFRPETVTIDADVTVSADTIIEPFVQLLGCTTIGEDCRIRSHSIIENSKIENNVLIRNGSLLTEATIGTGSFIGPYAHIRPGSEIGEGAHIGNFVETKKIKTGQRFQGQPSDLPRRRRDRLRHEYWRRNHHLQL